MITQPLTSFDEARNRFAVDWASSPSPFSLLQFEFVTSLTPLTTTLMPFSTAIIVRLFCEFHLLSASEFLSRFLFPSLSAILLLDVSPIVPGFSWQI